MKTGFDQIKSLLTNPDNLIKYSSMLLQIIIVLLLTKLVFHFGNIIIDKFFIKQKNTRFGFNERKADTLSALLKSILKYILYFIAALSILDAIGFPARTLLVGAGLGGVAIGFGAQSFVKDVITGFFILFEDQFSVGEYITIDDMSGVVETVGLRVTKLKDFNGDLHIIPNGSILKVTNHSRDHARALVDVEIGFEVNIDKALEILGNVCEEVKAKNTDIVEGPSVLGVTELGDRGAKIRIVARTKPLKQWGIEMELRKQIKDAFEKEKIFIPYPTRVIITKSGNN